MPSHGRTRDRDIYFRTLSQTGSEEAAAAALLEYQNPLFAIEPPALQVEEVEAVIANPEAHFRS